MELVSAGTLATFATDMGANVSSAVSSLWPILLVVGGVPFAFYVLRKIIALIPKR